MSNTITTPSSITQLLPFEILLGIGDQLRLNDAINYVSTCRILRECKPEIERLFRQRLALLVSKYFERATVHFGTPFTEIYSTAIEPELARLTLYNASKIKQRVQKSLFRSLVRLSNDKLKTLCPIPKFFAECFKGETLNILEVLENVRRANDLPSLARRIRALMEITKEYVEQRVGDWPENIVADLDRAAEVALLLPLEEHEAIRSLLKSVFHSGMFAYFSAFFKKFTTFQTELQTAINVNIEGLTLYNLVETYERNMAILFRSLVSLNDSDLDSLLRQPPEFIRDYFTGYRSLLLRVLRAVKSANALEGQKKSEALMKIYETLMQQRRFAWAIEILNQVPEDFRKLHLEKQK